MKFISKLINTSSIGSQLSITVAIGIVFLLFSTIYASAWVSNQQLRQLLIKQGMQATSSLSENSKLALLYDSPENAKVAINATLAFPGVTGIAIYKTDYTLLYRTNENISATFSSELFNAENNNSQVLIENNKHWKFSSAVLIKNPNESINEQLFSSQLSDKEKLIGYVLVVSSKDKLKSVRNGILLTNSIVITFIGLLLLFALHKTIKRLTKPLNAMSEVMKKTEQGEYAPHISHDGPLEVHHIADTYNRMIKALEERDETLRKQNIHLESQATHDHLTGLTNRIGFEQLLESAIEECKTLNKTHALCYMDLDKFKIVNDSCGHNAGDELLQAISHLFGKHIRKDSDTLARVGGDEFTLILKNCSVEKAASIGNEICKEIENYRFNWEGNTFSIGISIGIIAMDKTAGTLRDMVSLADSACYIAKENGRGQVHVIKADDKDIQNINGETKIASEIIDHLDNNKFVLYCQTIKSINPNNDTKHQYEILLRMKDNEGKSISPDKFISSAERYNLMSRIDRWVIAQTLKQLSINPHFISTIKFCTINISVSSIKDDNFLAFIKEQFKTYNIKAELICFEITESASLSINKKVNDFIKQIHNIGCTIALEDFVCNSTSFSHIKNMKVDYLKIHGDLFKDITNNPVNHAMIRSINEISHILNIETIAEHIETKNSFDEAIAIGINYAQGYFINTPTPLSKVLNTTKIN
ncbi:diguanylate cyclase/phosphodiesterase (GGDEF & EAL domains) with PAS/PAC sensor(s) [hydrothermal vent metagenome]|uniref:Diguanylate cyclase/phosphodiesterase (GGDEF & EAL domains) with PAS/PAC sensor(S) n=1 Tax=hydrothermal vent metagenome TaxID=652676 RepID=A0A3B0WVS8_9ZZZZ